MSRDDFYASALGAAYSAYMERPRLSRPLGRLIWGGDTGPYYESMGAIDAVPAGGTIVDCPCGAGPALRALRPDAGIRYLAVDLSPAMLDRARRRAQKRSLDHVEVIEARAEDLPVETGSVDLFLSYWGLHCFPEPRGAVAEIARVLRHGGLLVGSTFVRCAGLRQRVMLRPHRGDFGPMCTEEELLAWLRDAHLRPTSSARSGLYMFFEATRAGGV